MTSPTPRADAPEPMSLAEIRALLAQTAELSTENARAIAEMRASNAERAAQFDQEMEEMRASNAERDARFDREMEAMREANAERDARHDREMAEIRAGIAELTAAQNRANQDVSTLKGWGLELYCERNPQIFSKAMGMTREEVISNRDIRIIADEAEMAGFITSDQYSNLSRADLFIYGRRKTDKRPVCLVLEASYRVDEEDVDRASERANILDIILKKYQPRHLSGEVVPIVAGMDITPGASSKLPHFGVTYVPVQNGNRLTNPPE